MKPTRPFSRSFGPTSTRTARRTWKPSTPLCGRLDGRVTFQADGSESGMIGTLSGAVAGTAVDVPSLRLRDLIERDANDRIDLLKLDIEGAEDAVLADCEPGVGPCPCNGVGPARVRSTPTVRRHACSSC